VQHSSMGSSAVGARTHTPPGPGFCVQQKNTTPQLGTPSHVPGCCSHQLIEAWVADCVFDNSGIHQEEPGEAEDHEAGSRTTHQSDTDTHSTAQSRTARHSRNGSCEAMSGLFVASLMRSCSRLTGEPLRHTSKRVMDAVLLSLLHCSLHLGSALTLPLSLRSCAAPGPGQ
jgi:hypothetical protein